MKIARRRRKILRIWDTKMYFCNGNLYNIIHFLNSSLLSATTCGNSHENKKWTQKKREILIFEIKISPRKNNIFHPGFFGRSALLLNRSFPGSFYHPVIFDGPSGNIKKSNFGNVENPRFFNPGFFTFQNFDFFIFPEGLSKIIRW